jgi:hypothetical protein
MIKIADLEINDILIPVMFIGGLIVFWKYILAPMI